MSNDAILTTPRLTLRPMALDQAADLFAIYHDPVSMRTWPSRVHASEAETADMLRDMVVRHADHWWAIYHNDTGEAIGQVGYLGAMVTGMGYLIRAADWRQGYGTEAVTAALDYGFATLGFNRVELWVDETNTASQALARKLGFRQRGQFHQGAAPWESPRETLVLGLRSQEWAARRDNLHVGAAREIAFYGVAPRLNVANVAETLAFYRDRLGFLVDYTDGNPPTFAMLSRGEWTTERMRIHLLQSAEPPAPGQLYVTVGRDLERLYGEITARGVTVTRPLALQPYRIREFQIEDNNGWLLTFASAV